MVRTLHRPPAGEEAHHRFEFLHGIDLERVHIRRPGARLPWFGAGLLLLAVLVVAGVLLTGSQEPMGTPETAHDARIEQLVQAHDAELEAVHDPGIARAIRARNDDLNAVHDSGLARALQTRNDELNAVHDSGIAGSRDR
jgi:hypothetical protein